MLEIKNDVLVVVLILLKHNGLFGRAISSGQLSEVDSKADNFHNSWTSNT